MASELFRRNQKKIASRAPGNYVVFHGGRPAYRRQPEPKRNDKSFWWFYIGCLIAAALIGLLGGYTAKLYGLR